MKTDDAARLPHTAKHYSLQHSFGDLVAKLIILTFGVMGAAGFGLLVWLLAYHVLVGFGMSLIERALVGTIISGTMIILLGHHAAKYLERLERYYRDGGTRIG